MNAIGELGWKAAKERAGSAANTTRPLKGSTPMTLAQRQYRRKLVNLLIGAGAFFLLVLLAGMGAGWR